MFRGVNVTTAPTTLNIRDRRKRDGTDQNGNGRITAVRAATIRLLMSGPAITVQEETNFGDVAGA
jgi:hypothetical protein